MDSIQRPRCTPLPALMFCESVCKWPRTKPDATLPSDLDQTFPSDPRLLLLDKPLEVRLDFIEGSEAIDDVHDQ